MKGQSHHRFSELEVFVQVVGCGNFSEAARHLDMVPSSISKLISRLETRLGIRLLNRTTRKIMLSPEGRLYYQYALRILTELDEVEESLQVGSTQPKGKVRITCSAAVAFHQLVPLIPELLALNPHIEIVLKCTDEVVDLIQGECDISIRSGVLEDSGLIAHKLFDNKMILVASPHYIKKHGNLRHPYDLKKHHCINFTTHTSLNHWLFKDKIEWHAKGRFSCDNGENVRIFALAGGGIARLCSFMLVDDINQGRLIPLLENWNDVERPFYLLRQIHIPVRVSFVVDYILTKLGGKKFGTLNAN